MSNPKKAPAELPYRMWGDAIVYGPGEVKVGPDFMEKATKYALSKIEHEKKTAIKELEDEILYIDEQIELFSKFSKASAWLVHLIEQKARFEKKLAELKG